MSLHAPHARKQGGDRLARGGTVADGGTLDVDITPLGLTAAEKTDLVAFLKTLDGEAIPSALLMNTSL